MSRSADLGSINCTQCGAGLSVLGGGRVLTHVCGYCGAVLDTQDSYKVLSSIGKRDHPDSPIRIGMSLGVDGAAFTVIGTIGKLSTWVGGRAEWVEHQLFSDTHGYAWLSYESGNFTFTRKIRDFPMSQWLSEQQVERAEHPPRRLYRDESYKYYETTIARITFMEGEFNWAPALDETTTTVSLLGPDAMVGLREGQTEREVELTRLLPRAEVIRQLELDRDPAARVPRHPLSPYEPLYEEAFLRRVFAVFAAIAFVGWMLLGGFPGQQVLGETTSVSELSQSYPFVVERSDQLSLLQINAGINNDWVTLGVQVTAADGTSVLDGARTIQYYSGRDSDGSWSEGSRTTSIRFRPDAAGPHTLTLSRLEGTAEGSVLVTINDGAVTPFWMMVVALLFGLGYLGLKARRALHAKARFAGSDWYED